MELITAIHELEQWRPIGVGRPHKGAARRVKRELG